METFYIHTVSQADYRSIETMVPIEMGISLGIECGEKEDSRGGLVPYQRTSHILTPCQTTSQDESEAQKMMVSDSIPWVEHLGAHILGVLLKLQYHFRSWKMDLERFLGLFIPLPNACAHTE